jgi:hypothetical protein
MASMRRHALLEWLASIPPHSRDAAIEEHLTLDAPGAPAFAACPPGEHLLGYNPAGIAPIVRTLLEVPLTEQDTLVDLGSGLGKVVLLARMLTGASSRGIEVQPALVEEARAAAARLGVDVRFTCADAREADLGDGTVFFLYAPFTGSVLAEVMSRLHGVARVRPIVVCALGVDLDRIAPWLAPRRSDAFWLTIYDGGTAGAARVKATGTLASAAAEAIAFERPAPGAPG